MLEKGPHTHTCAHTQFSTCTYSPGGGHTLHTAALCVCERLVASYWQFRRRPVNRKTKMVQCIAHDSNPPGQIHFETTCISSQYVEENIAVSVSHQGDVPVSRTQHLQDHLYLLEGWVTSILILLTLYPQCAWVDVGSCAQAKVFLLVNTARSRD